MTEPSILSPGRVNVTCDKCNKKYSIADEKVRGKSVKIRCKQCQNLITVQGPKVEAASAQASLGGGAAAAAPPPATTAPGGGADGGWGDEEKTRAMPAMDLSPVWFAMVKGKQLGPFDVNTLSTMARGSEISLRTYMWKQGMGDWKRASDIPDLSVVFAGVVAGAAPPPPPAAAMRGDGDTGKRPSIRQDVAISNEVPSPEITGKKQPAQKVESLFSNTDFEDNNRTQQATSEEAKALLANLAAAEVAKTATPPEGTPAASEPEKQPEAAAAAKPAEAAPVASFDTAGPPQPAASFDTAGPPQPAASFDSPGPPQPAAADQGGDPFAALGGGEPGEAPAIGEQTRFFIAQSGADRRNPWWKIAIGLASPFAFAGILFALGTAITTKRVEFVVNQETGEVTQKEVESSLLSAIKTDGIGALLSGEEAKRKKAEENAKLAAAQAESIKAAQRKRNEAAIALKAANNAGGKEGSAGSTGTAGAVAKADLDSLYGSPQGINIGGVLMEKKDNSGPKNRMEPPKASSSGGDVNLDPYLKVIESTGNKAFANCVEQALRQNPNLKVGKIELTIAIASSGIVTQTSIDPPKHDNTAWGSCIKIAGKRLVFPPPGGDETVDLKVPIIVGVSN